MEEVPNEFFFKEVAEEIPKPKKSKKRKISDETDNARDNAREKLRTEAQYHCKTTDEWSKINKLSDAKIKEFIDEKNFISQQTLHNNIFGFTQQMLGTILDKICKGDNHIYNEIVNDISLRQSIQEEGSHFISYLTNRYRLLALSVIDVYHGKMKEIQSRPISNPVEPEKENGNNNISENYTPLEQTKEANQLD